MHFHPANMFRLSPSGKGRGISCDPSGAFIDSVPLLKRTTANGKEVWAPRDCNALSNALSKHYGIPIDVSSKANGLAAIARALNEGSIARAQLAVLFLRFPEPPPLAKNAVSRSEWVRFIRALADGDLIKARWDVRWPAGTPDSQGGRFAPRGTAPDGPPGVGHNGGPLLEEGEAATEGDAAIALAPIAALATGALLASTVPAGGGEDAAVEELKIREYAFEQIHMHHPWPKYLGGPEDQSLVPLPRSLHMKFHGEVQRFAPHSEGTSYYDNLTPDQKAEIFRKLTEAAKRFDADNGTTLYLGLLRNGFPGTQ